MGKIIVITSGKGGVGKTTTAINLGAAMNHFGKDVLVIDGNLSTPNVGIHLGSPEVPVNLNHVLNNKAELEEAIYEHESGLKIVPASLSMKEMKKTTPEKLKSIRKDLEKISDYVIIDCAAGLGEEAEAAINLADEIIIITNPEMPAITDALKAVKLAEQMKKPVIGAIITKVRKDKIEMSPETVKEMLEVPIIGMVPYDLDISRALNSRDAAVNVFPKGKSSRAYKEIASKLVDVFCDSNQDKEKMIVLLLKKLGLMS